MQNQVPILSCKFAVQHDEVALHLPNHLPGAHCAGMGHESLKFLLEAFLHTGKNMRETVAFLMKAHQCFHITGYCSVIFKTR